MIQLKLYPWTVCGVKVNKPQDLFWHYFNSYTAVNERCVNILYFLKILPFIVLYTKTLDIN